VFHVTELSCADNETLDCCQKVKLTFSSYVTD